MNIFTEKSLIDIDNLLIKYNKTITREEVIDIIFSQKISRDDFCKVAHILEDGNFIPEPGLMKSIERSLKYISEGRKPE